ncbi:hypothetical protein DB347_22555 [Opitutaceae bacterium EW11]|nr:hypothetical protein DB347_22555 [Opitutaceae bacterium EW11]
MKSLRWKLAIWYTASLVIILCVLMAATYSHLKHELKYERWERTKDAGSDAPLHGSYSDPEIQDILGELWRLSLIYSVPIAVISIGIGYSLASKSMKPVDDLIRQLSEIGAKNLTKRVRLEGADREFQTIETNVNSLLARIETSFRHLTEFSGQVAHELRTPLTLMRLQVEENAARIDPVVAESLQDELRRLSEYVDQCLLLATAEQGRLSVQLEDLSLPELVSDMAETYELWAKSEGRLLTVASESACAIRSDPRYVRQMLHSLLSNAMRHGTGRIEVRLGSSGDRVFCRVENQASGKKSAGSGIGLQVTTAVASALGCEFDAALAGDRFAAEIRWPAAKGPA